MRYLWHELFGHPWKFMKMVGGSANYKCSCRNDLFMVSGGPTTRPPLPDEPPHIRRPKGSF